MSLEPRLDTEDGTAGELALFQNAMESRYGYRPKEFLPGALLNSRDADRFEGFQLARNLAASAAPQPRLTTLEREREELRTDALRLIEAAQPFATFNSSEPTITVRTPDVARLRAMLHAMRMRLISTDRLNAQGTRRRGRGRAVLSNAGRPGDAGSCRVSTDLSPLRRKNLACWCRAGTPCHADVLEVANEPR